MMAIKSPAYASLHPFPENFPMPAQVHPSVMNGQVIDNEFTPFGVTFSPNLFFVTGNGGCGPGVWTGMDGQIIVSFGGPGGPVLDFTMAFAGTVSAAMFAAIDNGGQYLLSAMLGANVIETQQLTIADFPGQGFIGFTGISFDRIRVQALSATSFGMDNLQLAVPEPATLALLGLGLAGLGFSRRKKA